ncbi:MAG TPA: serine hydrolase domain-containing protein [Aridibacter sp.]|nr:serine hydrolase domain-containing protein [Aridibacter sp.]
MMAMLKKRMVLSSSLILLLLLQPAFCPTITQQASPNFGSLEKVVIDELKETNVPGAAVPVVDGEHHICQRVWYIQYRDGTPVMAGMLFRIASTTKVYTAAVLTMLAEEGKLTLDEPIGNYIKGLSPKLSQVTALQLMSHTAGLKHESPSYGKYDESAMATTVRSWTDDYSYIEPGKVLSYSNPGITLAGVLIEEVGGKPYADQLSERLLKPLGMASTTFRPTMVMTYSLSQGHHADGTAEPTVVIPFSDNAAYWPAAFLFSSVNDLSRFAIMFMNGGKLTASRCSRPRHCQNADCLRRHPQSSNEGKYGYGLMIRDFRGVKMVEHGGAPLTGSFAYSRWCQSIAWP